MELSHINERGFARMTEVGKKPVTKREAVASGTITVDKETLKRIAAGGIIKGDVLTVAQIAGVAAAKKTWELIPMCHNIVLDGCDISFDFLSDTALKVTAKVRAEAKTGVEMEAIMAVSTALITVYDMVKSVDKSMVIGEIMLERKSGGSSGDYIR